MKLADRTSISRNADVEKLRQQLLPMLAELAANITRIDSTLSTKIIALIEQRILSGGGCTISISPTGGIVISVP